MAEIPAEPPGTKDWTLQVADRIESVVSSVRAKTTVPISRVAQIVVFGIFLLLVAFAAGVLLLLVVVRVIDVYLPFHPHARQVWVTYAILGALFMLGGMVCMRRRVAPPR